MTQTPSNYIKLMDYEKDEREYEKLSLIYCG